MVVVLASLRHGSCVRCGRPIKSLEESAGHWRKELRISDKMQKALLCIKGGECPKNSRATLRWLGMRGLIEWFGDLRSPKFIRLTKSGKEYLSNEPIKSDSR
jgi:hypothetical protein